MVVSGTGRAHGVGLAVVFAMVLCAMAADSEDGAGSPQIIHWETPGNLAATNPLGCVAPETVSATNTAADIASGARACLAERDYDRMADLLLVANAYAYYDTLRVTDPTAHAALGALFADRFAYISRSQRRRVFRAVDKLHRDEKRVGGLCATLSAAGPPRYRPTYMIAHGLMSFPGMPKKSPLREIDTAAGWRKALVEFVKCPGVVNIETPASDFDTSADEPVAGDGTGVDNAAIAAPVKEDKTSPEPARTAADGGARVAPVPAGVSAVEAPTATYGAGEVFRDRLRSGGEGPGMVVIPAGRFRMGCVSGLECQDDEKPVHEVTIPEPFALSVHEVTFEDYDRFTYPNTIDDLGWGRGNRPVIKVSWDDAKAYVAWLSSETGAEYRLPSEAEWEYAARAGSETKYGWGNEIDSNRANCVLHYCGDQWEYTSPAGSFKPNSWGLHDMHGNVGELVEDCRNDDYAGSPSDGGAWLQGECNLRVLRGGSWDNDPWTFRAASRDWINGGHRSYDVGFRVVRTLTP